MKIFVQKCQRGWFAFFSLFIFPLIPPLPASSQNIDDQPVCYMTNSLGQVVELNQLCSRNQSEENSSETMDESSMFFPDGNYEVPLVAGEIVRSDGVIISGELRFRPIVRNGRLIGVQFFKPDGTPLEPGERLTLPSGETVQRPSLEE